MTALFLKVDCFAALIDKPFKFQIKKNSFRKFQKIFNHKKASLE